MRRLSDMKSGKAVRISDFPSDRQHASRFTASRVAVLFAFFKPMGQSFRMTPIFSDLRENLESESEEARKNSPYQRVRDLTVLPTLHSHSNPSTTAKKIVLRAKVEPWIGKTWVKVFNSLRASTEADLMDEFGIRKACQWAGNSAATAMKNYALVRKTDFTDARYSAVNKSDAKSDALNASDAKSDAEPASTQEHGLKKNQRKKHRRESERLDGAVKWALRDSNKAGKHGRNRQPVKT